MTRAKSAGASAAILFAACLSISALFMQCAPAKIVYREAEPKPHPYQHYTAEKVVDEIRRLEALLLDTTSSAPDSLGATLFGDYYPADSTYTKDTVAVRLFALYIHTNNPAPDYRKACTCAEKLSRRNAGDNLYYRNWFRVLHARQLLVEERDSLINEIAGAAALQEKTNSMKTSLRRQTKTIDSLHAVVSAREETIQQQKEIIKKLEKLDLIMEKQRKKVE